MSPSVAVSVLCIFFIPSNDIVFSVPYVGGLFGK
jgi:hypothetical protein